VADRHRDHNKRDRYQDQKGHRESAVADAVGTRRARTLVTDEVPAGAVSAVVGPVEREECRDSKAADGTERRHSANERPHSWNSRA